MEKNLFKLAAKRKSRFPSPKGALTAEQLYDLNLTDLDNTARSINAMLRSLAEDSFVELKPDPRRGILQDDLDLVVEVIADKQEAAAKSARRAEKAELRRRLTDALATKQDEKLAKSSIAEIERQLNALDDED